MVSQNIDIPFHKIVFIITISIIGFLSQEYCQGPFQRGSTKTNGKSVGKEQCNDIAPHVID